MKELVPIKVKIGLRDNGHADHPDWVKLPMINRMEDMRKYCPDGWIYDKQAGHREVRFGGDWDSPEGMQWGCLLATREFANQALAAFPTLITELTEVQFEDFYNNCAMAHIPENKYDVDTLQGLKLEHDLKIINGDNVDAIKAKIIKALDPNTSEPGIKKSKNKTWSDLKTNKLYTIK